MKTKELEVLSVRLMAIAQLIATTVRDENASPRIRCSVEQVVLNPRIGGGICVHYMTLVQKEEGDGDNITKIKQELSWADMKDLLE